MENGQRAEGWSSVARTNAFPPLDAHVAAVRRFNRFYTQRIGVLREALYDSAYSLAEVRVLYELAHAKEAITATDLARTLTIDAGYLSRILRAFEGNALIRKTRSKDDGRQLHLSLTAAGRKAFAPLDRASHDEIAALLAPLQVDAQDRVVDAMAAIESLLDGAGHNSAPARKARSYIVRSHRPGDIGWVISRHGALYAHEYGWDDTFEALVGEIAAKFLKRFDPKGERCWIAERNGQNVGSVFLVRRSPTIGQLRLLLVEPSARGLGIGRHLVTECIAFARTAGYRKIMLWTNAGLDAARHIYEDAGFRLTREERHHSFGKDLVGQTFELKL
ncbi:MAG TPA: bifunctional helix-turn-helix transcriptional regulator/GNAT family N-acetyltransferase [Casimicrobiaceae bacterium]